MAIRPFDHSVVGEEMLPESKRHYVKFTLHESGLTHPRRIHAIVTQAKNGKVLLFDGLDLPLSMDVYTGPVQGGRNLMQVLMDPDKEEGFDLFKSPGKELPAPPKAEWPASRTALAFAVGFIVHAMWSVQHELLMLFTQ